MMRFNDFSVKQKLVFISMLSSAAALLITLIIFFTGVFFGTRATTQERISSLARVIGTNCVAAIIFDDPAAARETLKALTAEPQISSARIYKADGVPFAEYMRDPDTTTAAAPDIDLRREAGWERENRFGIEYLFKGNTLHVRAPIELEQKVIGVVELSSDLEEFYHRARTVAFLAVAVLLFSFLVAFAVSTLAQRTISRPITTLIQTMNRVSREKDYAVRVTHASRDDLGRLFQGFNTMLTEIQARDEKLYFTQFSVDHMGDAAYWMDIHGRIVNVNNAACEALGLSRDKLLSMTFCGIDPNLSRERWQEIWDKARQRKAAPFETTHMRKDGKIFPVEVYANFLQFQNREYLCAFARNIADRKKLQFQLEQAQKMEAIGTLASGVAHDLNNILGGLVGYPDLLLMDLPKESPMRRRLMMVKKSGEKAAAIVQDMLTLARRGVDLRAAVNINEIVTDYMKSSEHDRILGFHPHVYFEVNLEKDLPNILGADVHLSKALMNLVSNAAEAISGSDAGKVTISTYYRRLEAPLKSFQTIAEGEYVVLRVEDDGAGLSEEDMANIFEPFYTKKKMGRSGTGLGMSVVSGTVKDHKGFIDLKSVQGKGTCFELYFPITLQVIQQKGSDFAIEAFMGSETVLVVDDVQEQREVASVVLAKLGYKVHAVSSGEEALAYLQKESMDLLVLDMIMDPGIDGLETYKRALRLHPNQKAVVASGFAETDRVREIMSLGVGGFVRKPYNIETLATAVKDALHPASRGVGS